MSKRVWAVAALVGAVFCATLARTAAAEEPVHALAMHGAPKYQADFSHFDYVNPAAPKGGEIRMAAPGSFDTLNAFVLKGDKAPGVGMVTQTLMAQSDDEAFSAYGQIAASVEVPEDRSWVVFNLRPEARWHDGKPLTAADVVWSFNTLMEKGHPFYRSYYANVKEAVAENPQRVKFVFNMAGNRELPLIMGQMPVLPKHYWEGKDFSATTLEPPLGSGPYRFKSVDAGRRIVYERVKDWWGADLPVNRGMHNFDTIVYDLYRDETVLLQAFFAGEYDVRVENIAKAWNTEYDHPQVRAGMIRKEEIAHELPAGMQAFILNTRRPVFSDPLTRRALNYAFDFEWSNKQFAFGTYKRTGSYFANSELAATGLPSEAELAVLEPFRGKIPDAVFSEAYTNPKTSGSGQDMRSNLMQAKKLLEEAGWEVGASGLLERNGVPFRFEILSNSDAFQRWVNPMIANLKKIGVEATLRIVDSAQYQNRMDSFDYDVTVSTFAQSLSPGNEQRDFWGAANADVKGSRNLIGVRDPAVDALIDRIVSAPDRDALVASVRALDRVLLWGHYVIPQWHINYHRLAYWDKFGHPAVAPKYGIGVPETWWYDAEKSAAVAARTQQTGVKQ